MALARTIELLKRTAFYSLAGSPWTTIVVRLQEQQNSRSVRKAQTNGAFSGATLIISEYSCGVSLQLKNTFTFPRCSKNFLPESLLSCVRCPTFGAR